MTDFKATIEYTNLEELKRAVYALDILIAVSKLKGDIREKHKYHKKETWSHEELMELCQELFEYENDLIS